MDSHKQKFILTASTTAVLISKKTRTMSRKSRHYSNVQKIAYDIISDLGLALGLRLGLGLALGRGLAHLLAVKLELVAADARETNGDS